MTVQKQRKPQTFPHAVTKIMAAMTAEGAAQVLGNRTARSIYAWADPDQECLPNVLQAALLDAAYENEGHGEPPLRKVYEHLLMMATVGDARRPIGNRLSHASAMVRETAEGIDAFLALLGHETIGTHDGNSALQELEEASETIERAKRDIEARMGIETVTPIRRKGSAGE